MQQISPKYFLLLLNVYTMEISYWLSWSVQEHWQPHNSHLDGIGGLKGDKIAKYSTLTIIGSRYEFFLPLLRPKTGKGNSTVVTILYDMFYWHQCDHKIIAQCL